MANFTAAIAGLAHSRAGDLRNGFGLGSAKPDGMALPVAVGAVQFTAGAVVMEGALGQVPNIGFCWYRGSRSGGSMDSHDLLVFGGGLSFLALLLIPTLPLFVG